MTGGGGAGGSLGAASMAGFFGTGSVVVFQSEGGAGSGDRLTCWHFSDSFGGWIWVAATRLATAPLAPRLM